MDMEQMKQYYRRFLLWQQAKPLYVNRHEGTVQQCHNCGTEFADNFCPRCGQRAGVGRVGWNSIRENITLLWGLDSRSLTYTLAQLMGRPGYLVRDYISGHRQVSFPPVKMLVIVCLFMVVFESVFHVKNDVLGIQFNVKEVDDVIAWLNSQKSWTTLLIQSLFILPTWLVFRFAPGYPRHMLPEGFFLQVFMSVQGLVLSFFGYWSDNVEIALGMVYMYITYLQLFGYGWWSTLWRLVVVGVTGLAVMGAMIVIVVYFYLWPKEDRTNADTIEAYLFIFAAIAVPVAVALSVTHLINKRTYRKHNIVI